MNTKLSNCNYKNYHADFWSIITNYFTSFMRSECKFMRSNIFISVFISFYLLFLHPYFLYFIYSSNKNEIRMASVASAWTLIHKVEIKKDKQKTKASITKFIYFPWRIKLSIADIPDMSKWEQILYDLLIDWAYFVQNA